MALLERDVASIAADVSEIKDSNKWILRVLGAAFITGSVMALIAQLVR